MRTNIQYSGDKLFVQQTENKTIEVDSINCLGNRSAVICRKLLETICYGDKVISPSVIIEDKNRKQYHNLLKPFSHYNCKQIYNKIFALAFLLYKKKIH